MKHSNHRVDPGEYQGPDIPVMAAITHGQGRVVVIGDHNMLGVQWLGAADNLRFALNAFAWLAKRENERPAIGESRPSGIILGVDLPHSDWNIGLRDRNGFHPCFINFARHPDVFPMGLLDLDDPADILAFFDPPKAIGTSDLEKVSKRLAAGQRVILLMDPSEPKTGSLDLLRHLVPDLHFIASSIAIGLDQLDPKVPQELPRRIGAVLPVFSKDLDLEGLEASALLPPGYHGAGKHKRPKDLKNALPYLLDITVDQGEPMAVAKVDEDQAITILQRIPSGNGELILMPQAKMWSNETFGTMRDEPFNEPALGAHELQMAFLRWIAANPKTRSWPAPRP